MLVYGPVPYKRLGKTLVVNNIPLKNCSYGCLYCELGHTTKFRIEPVEFFQPSALLEAAEDRIEKVQGEEYQLDFVSFVPDGEPTLDRNLGAAFQLLKEELSIPVAVITNGSLLWREEVAEMASSADWVSVKVDSTKEAVWRRINRPDERLKFRDVLSGIERFSHLYAGQLVTETMLVADVNTGRESLCELAGYLQSLQASKSYLSVPIHPPAEREVRVPEPSEIELAEGIFTDAGLAVECLQA